MVTNAEREERLKELKRKCSKCAEDAIGHGVGPINPQKCKGFCSVIEEIQELETQIKKSAYKGRKS